MLISLSDRILLAAKELQSSLNLSSGHAELSVGKLVQKKIREVLFRC